MLSHLALDSALENLEIGERELALKHNFWWEKNDLIIYDRRYPSYDFKYEHIKKGVDFLIRATTTHSKAVICFVSGGEKSLIIEVFPQKNHCFKEKDYNKKTEIKIQLVRIDLPNGETAVLMTSLLDSQKYSKSCTFWDGE